MTRYGHLSRISVEQGQRVDAGQIIGLSGGARGAPGSGDSRGPHLHFETRLNGHAVDPRSTPLLAALWKNNPSGVQPNIMGLRPGGRFAPTGGIDNDIARGARQIILSELRGQDTPEKLIGGIRGADGKMHGGYAPAVDHNDVPGYLRLIGSGGLGPHAKLDPNNTAQLAQLLASIARQEHGVRLDPHRIQVVIETRGIREGLHVTAKSSHGAVTVARSMPGGVG